MSDFSVEYWIETLKLTAHPEGGYFSEVYRSTETLNQKALPDRFSGDRSVATSIYFLLKSEQISKFHRIKSDEIWHFYKGSSLDIHVIHQNGKYEVMKLGDQLEEGQSLQHIVPAGAWFGATVNHPQSYTLVGCNVSPGFDFSDFELAEYDQLSNLYPEHSEIISKLT